MAAKKVSGPVCDCGEVVFDLTGKKPGSVVRCPWCRKRYRVDDDRAVTRLPDESDEKDGAPSKASRGEKPPTRSRMKPASHAQSNPRPDDEDEEDDEDSDDEDLDDEQEDDEDEADEEDDEEDDGEAENDSSEVIEEEEVEVFSFDSEDKDEEAASIKSDRSASEERARKVASEPTERLDRISRRRTDGQRGGGSTGGKGTPLRSSSSRPRAVANEPTVSLNRITRRTRKEQPVLDENGQPIEELPPPKPLDLEKWVFRMALGMVPVGTVLFMVWVIYGVFSGQRDFVTYRFFGLTIRGDNPWVWFAGIVMGGLIFLGMWVGYVYFFVHKKKQAEMEKKRRKEQEGGGSASGRRSTRRYGETEDE